MHPHHLIPEQIVGSYSLVHFRRLPHAYLTMDRPGTAFDCSASWRVGDARQEVAFDVLLRRHPEPLVLEGNHGAQPVAKAI
jgi:hypothetical protein